MGALIGVVQGVGEVTIVTIGTLSDTVRAATKGTQEIGGDVAVAGQGAVDGALVAAKSVGLTLEGSVTCVAKAAIEGTIELGGTRRRMPNPW